MTEYFYLRVVTAYKGGQFTASQDIRFSSRLGARKEAERLQEEFDLDCEPKRAYVLGPDLVPVEAAGRFRNKERR